MTDLRVTVVPGVPGPTGATGPQGPPGPAGPSTDVFTYTLSATTSPPPGSAEIRLNNSNQALVTTIWVSDQSDTTAIPGILGLVAAGDHVALLSSADTTLINRYTVTSTSTAFTGYHQLSVTWLSGNLTVPTGPVTFAIARQGVPGPPGPVGPAGSASLRSNPLTVGSDTMDRRDIRVATAMGSGIVYFDFFTAATSMLVSSIGKALAAPAASPTAAYVGLYSVAPDGAVTLMSGSPNTPSGYTTASVIGYIPLTTAQNIVAGTRYAVGSLVVAPSNPNVFANNYSGGVITFALLSPRMQSYMTTSGQTVLPGSLAAGAQTANGSTFWNHLI